MNDDNSLLGIDLFGCATAVVAALFVAAFLMAYYAGREGGGVETIEEIVVVTLTQMPLNYYGNTPPVATVAPAPRVGAPYPTAIVSPHVAPPAAATDACPYNNYCCIDPNRSCQNYHHFLRGWCEYQVGHPEEGGVAPGTSYQDCWRWAGYWPESVSAETLPHTIPPSATMVPVFYSRPLWQRSAPTATMTPMMMGGDGD